MTYDIEMPDADTIADTIRVSIALYDTAGQERHASITRSYYRSAMCVLLVFDITDYASFASIKKWFADINENNDNIHSPTTRDVIIILIGNKYDLVDKSRQVTANEAENFASEYNLKYVEASACTGHNISDILKTSASDVYTNVMLGKLQCPQKNKVVIPMSYAGHASHVSNPLHNLCDC